MSLMDIFSGFSKGSAPTAAPAPNTAPVVSPHVDANTTVPNNNTPRPDGKDVAVPVITKGDPTTDTLANYKDMWKPQENPTPTPSMVPTLNIDNKTIGEAAAKLNFMQAIPQELAQKAMSGDADSFTTVINRVAQQAFAAATSASGTLVQNALAAQEKKFKEEYQPDMLRQFAARESMGSIPLANDPATLPLVEMLNRQLMATHPSASPSEITAMTNSYLTKMAESIISSNGGAIVAKNTSNPQPTQETDWGKYFNMDAR